VFKPESPEPAAADSNIVSSPLQNLEAVTGLTISEFVRAASLEYQKENVIAFVRIYILLIIHIVVSLQF